ncbi:hypothetical protein CASFOL_029644 [Castilleja foliolosa]|uniref:Uncharacterized protein n=1 Tax=Castilleja foliolosa TaxID=1961234 RepID=A0ABD3CBB6_9LAMI
MGKRRKTAAVNGSAMAGEEKSSDASIVITSSASKSHLNTDNPSIVEPTNVENNVLPTSNGSEVNQKKARFENELVRRSGRLKSMVSNRSRGVMKPTVEFVNLTENGNEKEKRKGKGKEEATRTRKADELPVVSESELRVETQVDEQVSPRLDGKELSLDEKINYLVRMVDEFKPKVFGKTDENPSPDLNYKSLYIQTQKKYEALMEDHYEVVRRLEFARGQIAAYEKMKDGMSGASREVILVSDLEKLTGGGGANVHQMAQNRMPCPSVTAVADEKPKEKKSNNKKKKAN